MNGYNNLTPEVQKQIDGYIKNFKKEVCQRIKVTLENGKGKFKYEVIESKNPLEWTKKLQELIGKPTYVCFLHRLNDLIADNFIIDKEKIRSLIWI